LLKKLLVALVPVVALIGWLLLRGAPPPEVPFISATRETLVSTLTTNGKVEPIEWAAIHSEVAGPVERVAVRSGESVQKGQIIATISVADARNELASATSRISQAQAELETLAAGGRASELAEIDSGIARARADADTARREIAALERLVAKKAATESELTAARETLRRAELQIQSLELRRKALVTQPDERAARARLHEAQSGAAAARQRLAGGIVRSPISGILYSLDIRPGDFLQPGAPVARVGRLDRLRVILYVDEPELGRVERGMPVAITWDARPGREWKGVVEHVPLQVVPVGTRQIGEVICHIDNPDLTLIPGTNINAEVRSRVVEHALTLPKEAIRREGDQTGVLAIDGDRVAWRPVKVGAASVTRVQVLTGVSEGDRIALPVDAPLKSGDQIRPVARS
jgi:HlyD family secretion protein